MNIFTLPQSAGGVLLGVAILLTAGFLMTRLTRRLHLPNVTGYILAGILVGPYALNLIPAWLSGGMEFVTDLALSYIAFSAGRYFRIADLKRSGGKVLAVTLAEALCAAVTLLSPMASLLEQAARVTDAAAVFLLAAVPVYAGLLFTAGNTVTAPTYGALSLAAANAVSVLSSAVLIPVLRVFLAFSVASAVTSFDLKRLTDALYKVIKWALVLAVTVYTGVLSVQTIVANSAEMAGGKAAKMLVSGAIPIVGSAFSDAFSVIVSGAALVKNGVGAFGLLASLAIFLPLCIKAAAWLLICFCAGLAAEVLGLKPLASFLNGCAAALRLLIAAVCSVGAVAVVSAAVVLCVRGAYA